MLATCVLFIDTSTVNFENIFLGGLSYLFLRGNKKSQCSSCTCPLQKSILAGCVTRGNDNLRCLTNISSVFPFQRIDDDM